MTSYLSKGASTGGRYGLYRWDFKGPRSGPDPQFHRSISEAFFVLSGEIRLYDGRRWVMGRPGDCSARDTVADLGEYLRPSRSANDGDPTAVRSTAHRRPMY